MDVRCGQVQDCDGMRRDRILAIACGGKAWLVILHGEEDNLPPRPNSPANEQTRPNSFTKNGATCRMRETANKDHPHPHQTQKCHQVHNHVTTDAWNAEVNVRESLCQQSPFSSFQPPISIGHVLGFDRKNRSPYHGKRMEKKIGSIFSAGGKLARCASSHVPRKTPFESKARLTSPAMNEYRPFLPDHPLRAPFDGEGASTSPPTPSARRCDPPREKKLPGLSLDAAGRTWRRSASARGKVRGHGRAATVAYAAFGRAVRGKRDRRSARMERIQKRGWKQRDGDAAKTCAAPQGC